MNAACWASLAARYEIDVLLEALHEEVVRATLALQPFGVPATRSPLDL